MKVKYIFAPLSILFLASCSGNYQKPVKTLVTPVLTSRAEFSNLRFLGEGGSKTLVVYSGMDSDLKFALQNIIPADWTFKYSPSVSKALLSKVSWDAGQQWLYVLDSAMRANSLFANINWNKKQVDIEMVDKLVRPQPVKPTQPPAIPKIAPKAESNVLPVVNKSKPHNPFAAPDKPPTVTNSPHVISGAAKSAGLLASQPRPQTSIVTPIIPKVTTAPTTSKTALISVAPAQKVMKPVILPPIKPVPQLWTIPSGTNLKDGVVSWAAKERCYASGASNWTVIWSTDVVYRVDAPLNFSGTFKEALNGLFKLYGIAETPLYAGTKTQQCLVMVSDKEPL